MRVKWLLICDRISETERDGKRDHYGNTVAIDGAGFPSGHALDDSHGFAAKAFGRATLGAY